MKETWLKIKEWWFSLGLREKQAVAIGGTLLTVFIVYIGIWNPIHNATTAMRTRIVSDEKTLVWMRKADKEIQKAEKESKRNAQTVSPVVLLGLLQKQITHAGLDQYLTQLKQANNDGIEMHFQKVEFDRLMTLLLMVVKENNVTINQMSVISDTSPGLVTADINLS